MADPVVLETTRPAPRSIGRSALLTLPLLLWALLMFSHAVDLRENAGRAAALLTCAFMVALFFLMVRTRRTYRWRRVFFVALGVLFPIGFIAQLYALRGSMSIPVERMLSGDTPFCFLAIPMLIVPAALTRTVIFPGSILPTASNPHSVATMIAVWFAATLVLGKAWCAFGCFFGGIEEGFAALPRKAKLRDLPPRLRWVPWSVLAAVVLLSAATFEPTYCMWLCPFKAVTEFPEVRSAQTAIQFAIFGMLFGGLVVVMPLLTRLRTQCTLLCPFGAFQSLFNKLTVFDVRIDRSRCTDCVACRRACPTLVLDEAAVTAGGPGISCMKCGACVDSCTKQAAVWHVKGTPIAARPETARLLFLYPAWSFATLFGGSIIAGSLAQLLRPLLH
ncbi:MAG TPA: 4Fe-4S binding protein [Terriglobales bacterium]|nr:4Fe-4S binding protein [Terriglobales bacterium]